MYTLKSKSLKTAPKSKKKLLLIAAAVIALCAVAIFILESTNTTHVFHEDKKKTVEKASGKSNTTADSDKGEKSQSVTNNTAQNDDTSTNTTQPEDNKTQTDTTDTNAPLTQPTGNFISNHRISLSSSPAPQSSCVTTPGATCQIIFTNGTVTKQLVAQTTDRSGATYWTSWNPKDVGLTEGTWTVKAHATLGSQIKDATDGITLEVRS